MQKKPAISFCTLFLLGLLLTFTAQWLHEIGHWMILRGFNRDPLWSFTKLVQVWEETPPNPEDWQKITTPEGETGWLKLAALPESDLEKALFPLAGPAASLLGLLGGLAAAAWSGKTVWRNFGRALAISIGLGMSLYYLRAPWRTGGDEIEFARAVGIAPWVPTVLLSLAFLGGFALALWTLPDWKSRIRWAGGLFGGSILAGICLFFLDARVIQGVLKNQALFQPFLGFSLPVFLLNALCTGLALAILHTTNASSNPS
jgi:hypothetical protein